MSLSQEPVVRTLDRLHLAARGDWKHFVGLLPRVMWKRMTGGTMMSALSPKQLGNAYIPVTREAGRFLYVLARSIEAKRMIEFGTSFGISTIYLAAAARDSGGRVISTEIEPHKCRTAEANLRDAGLADYAEILEGDALQTLRSVEGPIDLLFLDGWKDLYIPLLELLQPRLRKGAIVVADNVDMIDCKPYLERVRAPGSGFTSTTMFGGRMELSCL